jgi:hypothetical protein
MNFIVETKNEYTIQLVNILTPLLYEGFESIYIETRKILKKGEEKRILKTFQQFIKKIPVWNNNLIETETQRIISQSKCEWLSDLLKAVIKSNIILLSNSNPNMNGKFLINHEYLNIPLQQFIHRCYIECARQIYSSPYLFFHNIKPIDRKRNQRECLNIIKGSIKEAIRKMLPVQHILREYLGNEYKPSNDDLEKPISLNESDNLKKLISKDLKDFINPDVVQNYNLDDKNSSNNVTYNDCSNEDFDDKETINLLLEIKKKYSNGQLLEIKSDKTLSTDLSSCNKNISPSNVYPLPSRQTSPDLEKLEDIKNSIGGSRVRTLSSRSYKDLNNESNSISQNNSTNTRQSVCQKNTNTSPLEEKSILNNNNSISYKIEHDSEYEDVFSNINNRNNINSEKKEKKKKKDAYFSKYNNI